jgi:hypothetical protein
MIIDELFDDLSKQMAEIQVFQHTIATITKKELKAIDDYYLAKQRGEPCSSIRQGMNMIFYDLVDNSIHYYAQITRDIDDQFNTLYLQKNKHYQWLLVEAYELFESFLINIYAAVGNIDKNIWLMSDYGSITLNEVNNKSYDWYLSRVKEKKGKPQSILNQFRNAFPDIAKVERDNTSGTNLRLLITLTESIRHIIVHKSGIVEDKDKFIKTVLEKSDLLQDTINKQKYLDVINLFFATGKYCNNITLLEIQRKEHLPLESYFDRLDFLTSKLMAYSYFIVECIKKSA